MNSYSIFDIQVFNVWLCASSLDVELILDTNDIENSGCFDSRVDGLSPYHIIQSYDDVLTSNSKHESSKSDKQNIARFSFIVPSNINNDKIYIEIQAKLSVVNNNDGSKRRILLNSINTASQITHFMDDISVKEENEISYDDDKQIDDTHYNIWILVVLFIMMVIMGGLCVIVICLMRNKRKYSKVSAKSPNQISVTRLEMEAMTIQQISQQTELTQEYAE